jgi:hypothetical protein
VFPHDDALVVTLLISNYNVHKVLIDTGSSADILFMGTFEKMAIDKGRILPMTAPLVGFQWRERFAQWEQSHSPLPKDVNQSSRLL